VPRLTHRLAGIASALAVLGILLAAILLGSGQAAFVKTYGVSMNPVYYQGDLVVVSRADSYSPGDIAAYHLVNGEVALHRIVGGDADGFTLKGDNNESVDVDHPAAVDLIGKAVLHIPHGGELLQRLTTPPVLGLAAFALLAGAAPSLNRSRRRRAARKESMSSSAASQKTLHTVRAMFEAPFTVWTATATVLGIVTLGLGAWAWTGPADAPARAGTDAHMDFSYSAEVPRTPAYDDTTVRSPDPVFRQVADDIEVHYTYQGPTATISPVAELSTPGGWHTTVPLGDPTDVSAGTHRGTVKLDVAALEERAARAAKVTGLPASPLTIEVVPAATGDGQDFRPALELSVTPLQVSLVDPAALSVAADKLETAAPRALTLGAWQLSAGIARVVAPVSLLLAIAALMVIAANARRRPSRGEAEEIRRRWPSLVIPVQPVPSVSGRPVIDVVDFPTLAKLAERYGLLVLHWTRSGIETFIVQDDNTTYRYRSGDGVGAQPVATPAETA
jgi:signal peptidase I